MPGLRLTEAQAQRLCNMDASTCGSALRALVSAGFLTALENGTYGRSDIVTGSPETATLPRASSVPQPRWRRILCLVELDTDTGHSLSPASHSALRYATTLAVTHRAQVTAIHVVPRLPQRMAFSAGEVKQVVEEQQQFLEQLTEQLQKAVFGEAFRNLIDVHVAVGTPNEELLRVATEIEADLIVLGRREDRMVSLSHVRDVLHHAPCPVLVVHPSGQAAVA